MSDTQNMDTGVKTFMVGGQPKELMFSAAVRFRLFLDVPTNEIQHYITNDLFKIKAVCFLLFGKQTQDKNVGELIDMLDETGLTDSELEEIVGWVRQRTLNFMLKEAEETAKALQTVIPQATELNSTLNGIQT